MNPPSTRAIFDHLLKQTISFKTLCCQLDLLLYSTSEIIIKDSNFHHLSHDKCTVIFSVP